MKPESIRGHMYQLLTTAAHAGSPLAILIYPELAEPVHWRAANARTSVRDVYAVGLNLFGYSRHVGVAGRAGMIVDMVRRSSKGPTARPRNDWDLHSGQPAMTSELEGRDYHDGERHESPVVVNAETITSSVSDLPARPPGASTS